MTGWNWHRIVVLASIFSAACQSNAVPASDDPGAGSVEDPGEAATPPFPVTGDAQGLLLVWFDGDGPHIASNRTEIPADRRKVVRVDSLNVEPDKRLDPAFVYVADLTGETDHPVRKLSRAAFDGMVTKGRARQVATAEPGVAVVDPNADVIIYGADWCGACKSAARYFRSRSVPFVEKNIEKDPAALSEMQGKARAAGVRPSGIPVIDFRGTILPGFNQGQVDALIRRGGAKTI